MRISDCPHPIEQRAFRENAYLEWMTCLTCGARWSRKTGKDDSQSVDGADNRSTSIDTSLSRMCIDDATTTGGKQNGDIFRMQSVSSVQRSGAHISYYGITCFAVYALMFSSSAHGGASDGIGLRFGRIGRELATMLNVPDRISCTDISQEQQCPTCEAAFDIFRLLASRVQECCTTVSIVLTNAVALTRQTTEGQRWNLRLRRLNVVLLEHTDCRRSEQHLWTNYTAKSVMKEFKIAWVKHYGWLEISEHDQGPEFMGNEFQNPAGAAGVLTMPIDSQSSMAKWKNRKSGTVVQTSNVESG